MWLLLMKKSNVGKYFVDLIRLCFFFFLVYGEDDLFFTFHASFLFLELVNQLLIPLLLGFFFTKLQKSNSTLGMCKKNCFLVFPKQSNQA